MKQIIIILLVFVGEVLHAQNQVLAELRQWLADGAHGRLEDASFGNVALTKAEADSAARMLWRHYERQARPQLQHEWVTKCFRYNDLLMPVDYRIFGEMPKGGRALYISMHGGGSSPINVNDGQWLNQIKLYQPNEGVYLAPRAAVDSWDMWHQPHVREFFERIIQAAVMTQNVNPDRVYLLGYSAGGDGVYRMAPRMADRWAAASMMAGHPGGVSLLNVRNIGLQLWMGANDGAYNRNKEVLVYGAWLDSMALADKGGYVHETHVIEGKGHWMERADTAAITWMSQFARNPIPNKIVWRQEKTQQPAFYWLAVPSEDLSDGLTVIVERAGNTFTIIQNDCKKLFIALNDDMTDLERPVKVVSADGKTLFKAKLTRTAASIQRSIEAKHDKKLIFTTYIELNL
jgi:hypothetical protein